MNKFSTFSRGKLLLTGEYLVLRGATALAVPLKLGQSFEIYETNDSVISWQAFQSNNLWFEATFSCRDIKIISTNNHEVAERLASILQLLISLITENKFLLNGCVVVTRIDFNRNWGFGSSSTLISNLAKIFDVNPFELNRLAFGSSGYDIACAISNQPILYKIENQTPVYKDVSFNPSFINNLYLIYSGRKQDTRESITNFNLLKDIKNELKLRISEISESIIKTTTLSEFEELIFEHEKLISGVLKIQRVKEKYFSDFCGEIKSLGAWGGDFMLATSETKNEYIKEYFKDKGLTTMFNYSELAIH